MTSILDGALLVLIVNAAAWLPVLAVTWIARHR